MRKKLKQLESEGGKGGGNSLGQLDQLLGEGRSSAGAAGKGSAAGGGQAQNNKGKAERAKEMEGKEMAMAIKKGIV